MPFFSRMGLFNPFVSTGEARADILSLKLGDFRSQL
jgi:hypothetical protein